MEGGRDEAIPTSDAAKAPKGRSTDQEYMFQGRKTAENGDNSEGQEPEEKFT